MSDDWQDITQHVVGIARSASGSLTVKLDSLAPFYDPVRCATITVHHRARWWKRPWLWLRRKPTRWESIYPDMRIETMNVTEDGGLSVDFASAPTA